ncbi:SusC/RagA family TonB-linked outer membrane protein [Empedobacter brevis]|uniref:SusC/RagA family TonB-linked outer membrane protein n=1 Tax=Empedobacter brevis TaxID=247 RepID=UPI0021A9F883|nr:SusC/RagA family TonB-linked outer membrane protein [Empedobacter brevis]
MRRRLTSLGLLAFLGLGTMAFAQVTGVVNDANNFPESDVEVTVKGTDKVTYTDENGNFNIDAKVGDTLVINGKEFKVTSNNLGALKYTSEDVSLDEVVVTSIFEAPQKAGQTIVKADQIKDFNPSLSVDQMLGGKVSGLVSQAQNGAPGSTANVTIRGALGLNGGVKSPLYVVDGTYMTAADVNSINPGDIDDIKVLKEASQLAVYGARGANGVVIVKTKSAKKGGVTISYSGRVGFTSMMDLPNIDLMNSNQLLNHQNDLYKISTGIGRPWTAEQITELSKINTDWQDAIYRNGVVTSNYFSISNNQGDLSQNFSIGHDKDNGAVNFYKGFERITSSYSFNGKASDRLRYGANVNGAYQTLDSPRDRFNGQSPFNVALQAAPYRTVYDLDANGNVQYDEWGYPIYNVDNGAGYPVLDEMHKAYNITRQFKLYGSGFLELEIVKNLTARSTFGATYVRLQNETFNRSNTYLAQLLGSPASKTDNSRDNLNYNWRNELNYVNKWDKHNLRLTVASEYQKDNRYRILLAGRTFPNNDLITQGLAQQILGEGNSYTNRTKIVRFGYIGAASYDYDRRYMLDVYVRRDGTSLAGWDNMFGTFWGASLGWDIAREQFLKGNKVVNSLVLKASYGEVGDDSALEKYAGGNFLYSNINLINLGFYNGQFSGVPSRNYATPTTSWEVNKKLNLGLDFSLLKNSLSGSFAYFQDKRTDFLFDLNYSPTAGGYRTTLNAGDMTTDGIEIDLNYDVLKSKNFDLSVYGNITNVNYKIDRLNGTDELLTANGSNNLIHQVGKSPYQYYMVRYAGIDTQTGDYLYYDKDGNVTNVYSSGDAVATGKTPLPKVFGGFGLNAKAYGFDINADFTYSAGAYSYNNVYQWMVDPTFRTQNQDVSALDYWKNPGDNTRFGKPTPDGTMESTLFLEKNDYILFRSLSVGYTFDDKLLKSTPVKSFRVYAQIQNLGVFTNYHGNPVQGTGSSETVTVQQAGYVSNSFSGFGYPMTRTFSLGVNVTF